MKALILAAGYATRLGALTRDFPKPLLPVAGRPIIDHLLEKVRETGAVAPDGLFVVTNHRFAHLFETWRERCEPPRPTVVDDGTTSDADKRGAIGDILYCIERASLDDDILVLAGDNLFGDALTSFVERFKTHGTCVGIYDVGSLEKVRRYSVVEVDDAGRITSFVEKPANPRSTLMAIAVYAYRRDDLRLLRAYRDAGGNLDSPGHFPAWLHRRVPVYGHRFAGPWIDIGSPEEYERSQTLLRP